ncbi:1,4-dihydroxy-6-naphthoate synthase [Caldalkalibacillus salinus]|uniref:1,4-dihydroxy-6-naphthoate synthase n=1 Tax=Caldalkalibacillus salinus TaxID=2803787 RepID=UPI00192337E8|nr:1,4-dihydroxy-6-naphthoate synthase [Caldalkalibacillus salinus]
MKISFSPCPNDTFIFHAAVNGIISDAPELDVTYADIDITNHLAAQPDGPDILKVSYAALPWIQPDYALLPCGGALGRGCGPMILVNQEESTQLDPRKLSGKVVAVPSERSTAYLLFRLWSAQNVPNGIGEIVVLPFHDIMPAVRDGKVDAGLVIHEARFTYPDYGLGCLVDLGHWWETDTGLPIPLGAIIAKRSLDIDATIHWIRQSLEYAWKHPQVSQDYVLEHAQEMSPEVAQSHIDLYVNGFSRDLGEEGYHAVHALLTRAAQENIVPPIDVEALRWDRS